MPITDSGLLTINIMYPTLTLHSFHVVHKLEAAGFLLGL